MLGSQTVLSILDEAAAAIGGWTALQSIRCVHLDSEGQDWELWQAHDIGRTVQASICSACLCAREVTGLASLRGSERTASHPGSRWRRRKGAKDESPLDR